MPSSISSPGPPAAVLVPILARCIALYAWFFPMAAESPKTPHKSSSSFLPPFTENLIINPRNFARRKRHRRNQVRNPNYEMLYGNASNPSKGSEVCGDGGWCCWWLWRRKLKAGDDEAPAQLEEPQASTVARSPRSLPCSPMFPFLFPNSLPPLFPERSQWVPTVCSHEVPTPVP